MMKRRQQGITIMEIVGAIGIGSMIALGVTSMIDTSLNDLQGQQADLHQAQIVAAAHKYVTKNYGALDAAVAAGPKPILFSDLQTFLPTGFSEANSFKQKPCVVVRKDTYTSKLTAFVVTRGGTRIPGVDMPTVAAVAGQGGGYISGTTVKGTSWSLSPTDYNTYNTSTCGPLVSGHLASLIYVDNTTATTTDQFLYRASVSGKPELNTMTTPIKMGAYVTEGDLCAGSGIFVNQKGLLVSCVSGVWSLASAWREPVANHAALPTGASPGEVRVALDVSRAFVFDGTNWVALAVDQNGDLAVPRNLTVQKGLTVVSGGVNIDGGNLDVSGSIDATGDINALKNLSVTELISAKNLVVAETLEAQNVNVSKTVRVDDSMEVTNGLSAGLFGFKEATSSPGVGCNQLGLIVPDTAKTRLLICNGSQYIYVQ